ncbi:MAG: cohesin domain-containing protein [Halanaerobiaceae bacterium]
MCRKKYFLFAIIPLLIILIFNGVSLAQESENSSRVDEEGNLRLENDYIAIIVNQDQNSQGRFAVETTGGAPLKEGDENLPLIYGRPQPWPSYTTINIDRENYVFGGETERRAGREGKYGEVTKSPEIIDEEKVITQTEMDGVLVDQILSFEKGNTTGLKDSVRIEYKVENTTSETRDIGLRIMLDTMLGENDGAPFRAGEEDIDTDQKMESDDLPQYWQAFDSISSPSVVSQGTFRREGLTLPDEVYFSDWGSLADGVWNFNFNPGDDFRRAGEYEIDSAMAMFWNPQELGPGETRTYTTEYGLGGVEVVPGLISIADSSPAEVTFEQPDYTFPIVIYIENDSDINLENLTVNLELSDGFTAENRTRNLGDFEPGEVDQVQWDVGADSDINDLPSEMEFEVVADADNTDANELQRQIKVFGPPDLQKEVSVDNLTLNNGEITPNPFTVTGEIVNQGGSSLYNTVLDLNLPPGLEIVNMDRKSKYVGELKPEEKIDVTWRVKILEGISGSDIPVSLNITGFNDYSSEETYELEIPEKEPLAFLTTEQEKDEREDFLILEIKGRNLNNIEKVDLALEYDPEVLEITKILPGTIFVQENRLVLWNEPAKMDSGIINLRQELPQKNRYTGEETLASLIFSIPDNSKEEFSVNWSESSFYDSDGNEVDVDLIDFE